MKFLAPIDLTGLELQNALLQNLGSAPGSYLNAGRIYYDTGVSRPRWYDGTSFNDIYKAASTATASTVVLRDGAGNFEANLISADLDGQATSAGVLAPGATIALTGKATASGVLFTGGSNISLTVSALSVDPGDITLADDYMLVGTPGGAASAVTIASVSLSEFGAPTADLSFGGNRITNVGYPSANTDAASKQFVLDTAQGLSVKAACRVATTGSNIDLVTTPPSTIDGVTLLNGDRVLVKDQTNAEDNGIYVVPASGAWSRSTDADENAEVVSGMFVFVSEGTVNSNSGWILATSNPIVVGTTGLTFEQFSGAGQIEAGSGLTKSGNTLHVGGTSNRITVNADTVDIAATYVGQTSITTLGTITTGTWSATAIAVNKGGTGLTSYTVGDLLYASGAATISKLADVATGNALISGGVGVAPSWGKIGLTTHVTGTLASGNGGTGFTGYANGDLLVGDGSILQKLTSGAQYTVLMSSGAGAGVYWSAVSLSQTIGTLTVNRGGTGVTSFTSGGLLVGAGTGNLAATPTPTVAGQIAVSTGAGTWTVDTLDGDGSLSATGALTISAGAITFAKFQNVTGPALLGQPAAGAASISAIAASADGQYMRRRSGGLEFSNPVYAANVPVSTPGTSATITHNLSTSSVVVSVYEVAAPYEQVFPDITYVSVNQIDLTFANGSASGEYRVVILGL